MSTLQSAKGIILCDLNETILSPQNQLTSSLNDFSDCITRAQQAGFLVGLCSDSSYETLVEYAKIFGMEGPLIIELRAAYALSKNSHPIVIKSGTETFSFIRDAFILELAAQIHDQKYLVVCGDANRIVEDPSQFDYASSGDIMIVVNGLRRYSFSFYVRRRMNGKWVLDPQQLRELEQQALTVGSFSSLWSDVTIDRNDHYGICIFHHRLTSKTAGVKAISQYCAHVPLFMIGDSAADRLLLPGVLHNAVANAKDEYKQHCERIATHTFTEGVIEIINAIIDHRS